MYYYNKIYIIYFSVWLDYIAYIYFVNSAFEIYDKNISYLVASRLVCTFLLLCVLNFYYQCRYGVYFCIP